jgi:hypothetical protein
MASRWTVTRRSSYASSDPSGAPVSPSVKADQTRYEVVHIPCVARVQVAAERHKHSNSASAPSQAQPCSAPAWSPPGSPAATPPQPQPDQSHGEPRQNVAPRQPLELLHGVGRASNTRIDGRPARATDTHCQKTPNRDAMPPPAAAFLQVSRPHPSGGRGIRTHVTEGSLPSDFQVDETQSGKRASDQDIHRVRLPRPVVLPRCCPRRFVSSAREMRSFTRASSPSMQPA